MLEKEQIEEIQNAVRAVTPGAPEWLILLVESHREQQEEIERLNKHIELVERSGYV